MKISRKRKQELMRQALMYAGQLVRQVVTTYEAFNDLSEGERTFIDEYIVSIGDRLYAQGLDRDERNRAAVRRIIKAFDK